jgi:hypothetical protein
LDAHLKPRFPIVTEQGTQCPAIDGLLLRVANALKMENVHLMLSASNAIQKLAASINHINVQLFNANFQKMEKNAATPPPQHRARI